MPSPAERAELARLTAQRAKLAHRSDPILFARSLGIEPDPWQIAALRSKSPRKLFNCHRQAGKSTTAAIIGLHRTLYVPRSLVLLISPSLRQSKELLRKVVERLPQLPVPPKLDEDNALSLEFANHSRIVSLPASEDTVRGFSAVSLIIEDEAGDVGDDLYRAVRPMLAVSRGDLILMGTPKGRRGHFFDAWENGGEAWERYVARAADCRRISSGFLDEERRALGPQFAQEYEGSFINSAEGLVYGGYDAARNGVEALPDADPHRPWRYLLGCDFGIVDPNALTVLAYRDHEPIVYAVQSYTLVGDPLIVADEIIRLDATYHFDKIVGDLGGMGKAFQATIERRRGIPIAAALKSDKLGYIRMLNADFREAKLKIVKRGCRELLDEMQGLCWVQTDGGAVKEDPSAPNHCGDSLLYSWRDCTAYGNRAAPPPKTAAELIRDEIADLWAEDEADLERRKYEQRVEDPNGENI